jgi:predicted RNA binding protein YcfA (HicA-like mRNA interferase family)
MDARTYLKQLKDDGWYLGNTDGSSRQYVHRSEAGVITVCVRHNDELGPETEASSRTPARDDADGVPAVVLENTRTGVSAYSPGLPGVIATGPDEVSTRERMSEAVALHRKALSGG